MLTSIKPPSQTEIKNLVDNAAEHLKRALILSYYTGIRPGSAELFSMKWEHIDFDNKTLFIISAKKNGLTSREIPFENDLLTKLDIWKIENDTTFKSVYIINFRGKKISSIKT